MRAGRSSQTAALVTCLRALADRGFTSAKGFGDPVARELLSRRWQRALRLLEWTLPRMSEWARRRFVQQIDALALRTLAIDAELVAAVAAGGAQVVILGAGFDGRAYRMAALRDTRVFEVDHRATQLCKQQSAAALARCCRGLTFVAVDFASESLSERLQAAGQRRDEPTVWLWEGVTMYLGEAALRRTLAAVAARSSRASRLIVEYQDADAPDYYPLLRRLLLRLWSEPQIGARSRDAMRAELEQAGLTVLSDSGGAQWAERFADAPASPQARRARLAVAVMR